MTAQRLISKSPRVQFEARPQPVDATLRPEWRVALIIILLATCGRGKSRTSSIRKLHALSWGAATEVSRHALASRLTGQANAATPNVRIDASLNDAVDLAAGYRYVLRSGVRVSLTEHGLEMDARLEAANVLVRERAFAASIKPLITEAAVERLFQPRSDA